MLLLRLLWPYLLLQWVNILLTFLQALLLYITFQLFNFQYDTIMLFDKTKAF